MATGTVSGDKILVSQSGSEKTYSSSNYDDANTVDDFTFTTSQQKTIEVYTKVNVYRPNTSMPYARIYYSLDSGSTWNNWFTQSSGGNSNIIFEKTQKFTLPAGKTFKVKYNGSTTWSAAQFTRYITTVTYMGTINISKTIFTRKSLPREEKELGNKCKTTLFGYHTDNTWYEGE